MLVAERRKRRAVADKIGHEEYIYKLNGDPTQLPLTHSNRNRSRSASAQAAGSTSNPLVPYSNLPPAAPPSLLWSQAKAPVIPSLAPPDSLPAIPPPIHYPKPPLSFHGPTTSYASMQQGLLSYPYRPRVTTTYPSSLYMPSRSYTSRPPSNLGISTLLPGPSALPPAQRSTSLGYSTNTVPAPATATAAPFSLSAPRVVRSGNEMNAVMNWGIGAAAPPPPAGALHAIGGNWLVPDARPRSRAPPPPPNVVYDPADLPPAGKPSSHTTLPTYFHPSDIASPPTRPRSRGSSLGPSLLSNGFRDVRA